VAADQELAERAAEDPEALWRDGTILDAKRMGFSDRHLAARLGIDEPTMRARRLAAGIRPVMKAVDTCGAEFVAETPYFYSTYEEEDEVPKSERPRVVILGSGP